MGFPAFIAMIGMISLVSAAVLNPVVLGRSPQQAPSQQACPVITIQNYVTVTVTDIPDVVTVAMPDYPSISQSLASASTIDSLVVVANSQNRPFNAPPNTVVPTFVHSINAPAVEATEGPHDGTSVYYVPNTRSSHTVIIGKTTESIILSTQTPITTNLSPDLTIASLRKNSTIPAGGWNGTDANATDISPAFSTGSGAAATSTEITYVSTTTTSVNTTITTTPPVMSSSQLSYAGYGSYIKRQTCILISAEIEGHWASWCNNWDGSTTYTFASWETTVTPGLGQGTTSNAAVPTSSSTFTSTQSSTTTLAIPGQPTTMTVTMVPPSSGTVTQSSAPASSTQGTGSPSCGEAGPFSIGFDDLPKQSVFDNKTAGLPQIFNPFEHFFWADGWSYLPPPNDPYPPHDGSQLAVYVPNDQDSEASGTTVGVLPPGSFSAGPRSDIDAYWFNVQSAWVGCDNNATDPSNTCDFVAEGYHYDSSTNSNRLHVTQHFPLPLCRDTTCQLQQIIFPEQFTQLTTVGFYAKVGSGVHRFYVDDIHLSWWNNTCEAGALRASGRK